MHPDLAAAERILGRTRRIAVVGLSPDHRRTSYGVAVALQRRGYEIVPVNPKADEVLGEKAWPTLADVPGTIDLVDVFRRQEHVDGVVQEAIAAGAPAIWLQEQLTSVDGRRSAEAAGIDYVEDACLAVFVAVLNAQPASATTS